MESIETRAASTDAKKMISQGVNPEMFVHLVTFPGYPEGAYCSTPVRQVEPGMIERYYQLKEVAGWVTSETDEA